MLLQTIKNPDDLKKIPENSLPQLSEEIREKIIEVVGKNGGHLASNLGVVELSIALHRVFSSPQDAIIWDVGHQCYAHKMITGRTSQFSGLRQKGGISGFTRISESPHDFFDAGHASSSISSALGLLESWKKTGHEGKVIAVIGDGALTGGMAYEALNHAGQIGKNLIIVLNDNQMSISRNTGSISRYLSLLSTSSVYQGLRYKIDRLIDSIPYINRHIGKFVYRLKRGLKGLFLTNNLFVDLGFEYVGPLNGHNIQQMEKMLRRAKKIPRPVVVHVITKKGKGYFPAENDPSAFHGVGPFNTSDGLVETFNSRSFTEVFSNWMVNEGSKNEKLCAVTAAMAKGTGLDSFSRHFKSRFYDVGIAEEHAVTFSGGLAAGGCIPLVAIYSTFIQRAIDQIIEDLALQKRHAVIVLDRAGAVPADGETHQGIFDIALLRPVPDMTLLSPCGEKDLEICLDWAVNKAEGPVVLRIPKATCPSSLKEMESSICPGRGILIKAESYAPSPSYALMDSEKESGKHAKSILMVCTGSMYGDLIPACRQLLLDGINADIMSLRFIKPFDEEYFMELAEKYDAVLVVEDGIKTGGIGEYINFILSKNKNKRSSVLAFSDSFVPNGNRSQILEWAGLSPSRINAEAKKLLGIK